MPLTLVHPARDGQDPPKRRRPGLPAPCLSLTPDESRHLRASVRNLARARYGSLVKLAAAMGINVAAFRRKGGRFPLPRSDPLRHPVTLDALRPHGRGASVFHVPPERPGRIRRRGNPSLALNLPRPSGSPTLARSPCLRQRRIRKPRPPNIRTRHGRRSVLRARLTVQRASGPTVDAAADDYHDRPRLR